MDYYHSAKIETFNDENGIELFGIDQDTDWDTPCSDPESDELCRTDVYSARGFRIRGDGFEISGRFRRFVVFHAVSNPGQMNEEREWYPKTVLRNVREHCGPINFTALGL
jgi:hypothetical protein